MDYLFGFDSLMTSIRTCHFGWASQVPLSSLISSAVGSSAMNNTNCVPSNKKTSTENSRLGSGEVADTNVPTLSAEEERKLYRKIDLR